MTTPDPDLLRRQIEHTQQNLSTDVDLLTEKVTPSQVARRRVNRARRTMTSVRDRVMGSDSSSGHSAKDRVSDTASSVADTASSMASDAAQTAREAAQGTKNAVQEAPRAIRRGTEGNPLAAGLIAFGAGWLLSTLAPPTKAEQELAEQATSWAREHSGPVKEQLGQVAEEMKENMREPVQQATESVKSTATDAVETVKDDTRSAAGDVGDRAQQARDSVQDKRS
jgi:gas vesicle protein